MERAPGAEGPVEIHKTRYDSEVASVERVWMRILGVLLILLGLVLFASPLIPYMRREKIGNSRYSVKSEKLIVVPRPVAHRGSGDGGADIGEEGRGGIVKLKSVATSGE